MRARAALLGALAALAAAAPAHAAQTRRDIRFTAGDGVSLKTTLIGQAPLLPRPTVVEFSPYGDGSQTLDPGPAYNVLLVQVRGTGDSDGTFDALGPRTQQDVQEVLRWACAQPWSEGTLALNGFSASAIAVYDSLHLALPCVRAAILKSGTWELYRDLLWPGGVSNMIPGLGVLGLIGAPAAAQGLERLQRDPASAPGVALGLSGAGLDGGVLHPSLDAWWRERGFRGDVDHLPILMIDGFFDVESRGAFQAYQALRGDGAHLLVIGAHDGAPAGTDGGLGEARAWLDHYVRGIDDGVERHPPVQLYLADGSRESDLAGRFVRYDATGWPVPATAWVALALRPDHTLAPAPARRATVQAYPALPSPPTSTDPPNTAIVGGDGPNQLAAVLPPLTETGLSEPAALTYTSAPLRQAVDAAGPLDLDVRLASTAPDTAIWAVIADVWPDGSSHPLTAGRLLTDYPRIDRARSLYDPATGALVQPYGIFSRATPAAVGRRRLYHVELWPVGNRFEPGHRIRLEIVGASAASKPGAPAIDSIVVGGRRGARLMFPVLPGSELVFSRGPAGSAARLRSAARRSP